MATHLITGAGSGIGRLVAERLHARGDRLVLVARDEPRAVDLAAAFPGSLLVVSDLARASSIAPAFAEALRKASADGSVDASADTAAQLEAGIDTVVHAAGVVRLGAVGALPLQAWESQLAVNLVAPAELTRVALPLVRAARGQVVFVNSGAGLTAHPDWSAYAASKHGLKALADALRREEEPNGVRVTTVYPGRTATPMQAEVHAQEGAPYDPSRWIDPASVATAVLAAIDLPRDAVITDLTVRPGPR